MPEAQRWAMAVGAPYAFVNHYHWARPVIGRNPKKAETQYRNHSQMLEVWGIYNRRTLLDALLSLLKHGHRADFEAQIKHDSDMSPAKYNNFSRWLSRNAKSNSDSKERLWQLRTARKNARDIRQVDFCAWDMVRFVMLCRSGAQLGFISEREMLDFAMLAAARVQRHYASWRDMGRHFMLARRYWMSTDINFGASHASFKKAVDCLLRLKISPWRTLRWDTPLPVGSEAAFANTCGVSAVFYQHEKHEVREDKRD